MSTKATPLSATYESLDELAKDLNSYAEGARMAACVSDMTEKRRNKLMAQAEAYDHAAAIVRGATINPNCHG